MTVNKAINMEIGTKFKLINNGIEDEDIVILVKATDETANRVLAWNGNIKSPLTFADTNINAEFIPVDQ